MWRIECKLKEWNNLLTLSTGPQKTGIQNSATLKVEWDIYSLAYSKKWLWYITGESEGVIDKCQWLNNYFKGDISGF